jgi:hypothetical protein
MGTTYDIERAAPPIGNTAQCIDLLYLFAGAQGRDRTTDTRIFSPLLYQLSYLGL